MNDIYYIIRKANGDFTAYTDGKGLGYSGSIFYCLWTINYLNDKWYYISTCREIHERLTNKFNKELL